MDGSRPATDPRLFEWTAQTAPPRALAALLLRSDTPSGLAAFLTPETILPRGVVAQLEASVSRGYLRPTEAGRGFLAAMKAAP